MECIKCRGSHPSLSHVSANPFFEVLSLQYDFPHWRAIDVALLSKGVASSAMGMTRGTITLRKFLYPTVVDVALLFFFLFKKIFSYIFYINSCSLKKKIARITYLVGLIHSVFQWKKKSSKSKKKLRKKIINIENIKVRLIFKKSIRIW